MAKTQHHPGYADQDQQDETVEALKTEHAVHVANGRTDRAKQVVEYAKQLGVTISSGRAGAVKE